MDINEKYQKGTERPMTRAVVFRCTDELFNDIMYNLRNQHGVFVVYSRSSPGKLFIEEGEF